MEIHCEVCQAKFDGVSSLATHLKKHRIAQKRYFEQYFPRFDLGNHKKIFFKSLEQYFISDFSDKTSMKMWLAKVGGEKALQYLSSKMKRYCEIKKITVAPPEFFIQTIGCLPSIRFMEKLCGVSYDEICKRAGLSSHFDYSDLESRAIAWKPAKQIVIDTREKRPIKFPDSMRKINIALDYGDYALAPSSRIVVERKSYSDFFGTFGVGLDRFSRELKRAKENEGYVVIMVESSYSSLAYTHKGWSHANPEYIFHRLRDLYKKFDCFQVVFCEGRTQMKTLIPKILGLGASVKTIDIQHCLERGIL